MYIVLIPFYRGDEYRERSIVRVIRHCWESSNGQCRIIISEQNSNSRNLFKKIFDNYSIPIEYINHFYSGRFNKSRAWNDGIRYIRSLKFPMDINILFLDADIIVESDVLKDDFITKKMKTCKVYHPFDSIADLDRYDSHILCNEDLESISFSRKYHIDRARRGYRCYGGAMIMSLLTFLSTGGFDIRFDAWGHEDDVFYYVCRKLYPCGQCIREKNKLIYHIYHPIQNTKEYIFSNKYKELSLLKLEIVRNIKNNVFDYITYNKYFNGFF